MAKFPNNPQIRWPLILDRFELEFAAHDGYLMWMVDFIRSLLTCRGVEQLFPGSSHFSLLISRWHEDIETGPPFVWVSVDQRGVFTLGLVKEKNEKQIVVRHRVESAIKSLRVLLKQLGIRLGPPHREQPPNNAYRRVWLFFHDGRWS